MELIERPVFALVDQLWISDPQARTGDVRSDVNIVIWDSFRENGIEIPYPQREVRVLGSPAAA